jgi:lactate dehydrogenase-like 2-hydroxyacid dehydrogenase
MPHAFILGGNGQIGLATASQMLAAGWRVTLAHRARRELPLHRMLLGADVVRVNREDPGALARALGSGADVLIDVVAYGPEHGRQLLEIQNAVGTLVVGLGNIGAQVARIGLAFGMEVVAWSQNMTAEIAKDAGAILVAKDELFRRADVVTIHLVLSARTRGLVGAAELALMKPASWLVNTSRAPIVDEGALIRTLESRAIAGAAIDVFSIEPLPVDHPFRRLDNVLATPHIGYVAEHLYRTSYSDTAAAVDAWLDEMATIERLTRLQSLG